jgi:plastocyanin
MRSGPIFRVVIVACALGFAVTACSSAGSSTTTQPRATADEVDITIDNFTFDESTVSVEVGTVVRWTNNQTVTHTVTSGDALWDMALSSGATFEFTFDEPGTYPYFCSIHPSMTGTVEVTG